jgi:FixJ family two-component response regulator
MTLSVNKVNKPEKILSPVLVIEDEGLMTALLKRYLSGQFGEKFDLQDNSVACFESGWDIVDTDLSHVHVAIVDLLVPRLSGVDFIKHLKKHYPHISFVPISGMATEPMKRQVRELLSDEMRFLEKPLRREEFQDAFQKAWNRTDRLLKNPNELMQLRGGTQGRALEEDAPEPLWTAATTTTSPKVVPIVRRVLPRKKGEVPDS